MLIIPLISLARQCHTLLGRSLPMGWMRAPGSCRAPVAPPLGPAGGMGVTLRL